MENLVRKRITNISKIILGIGLITFLVVYVEPKAIYETYLKANKFYFLVAVFLLPVNLYSQFYKWNILSKKYFGIESNSTVWVSLFYGISGGIFTPMKSGEYFARAIPYKKAKVFKVVMATIVDKFIPMILVILIGGSCFIIFLKSLLGFSIHTTLGLIIVYKISVFLILYFLLGNGATTLKFRNWLKSKKYLAKIIERIPIIESMDNKTMLKLIVASLIYHLTFTSQMTILLIAFSGEFNFILFFFAANLIVFVQLVFPPIALGELGVREGAAVYFLQNMGYAGAVGFSAALSLLFINRLIPLFIGLTLLFKRE